MAQLDKNLTSPPAAREKPPFLPGDAPSGSIGANRKILIVDDSAILLKMFELKLKGCGFTVLTAANGTEGIAAARREKPEVIVLDLNFPAGENFSSLNWSGLSILQWLKRYNDVAEIPIVILTAEESKEMKQLVLAAGAAAYFQKPVDLKEFIAELVRLIGSKSRSA